MIRFLNWILELVKMLWKFQVFFELVGGVVQLGHLWGRCFFSFKTNGICRFLPFSVRILLRGSGIGDVISKANRWSISSCTALGAYDADDDRRKRTRHRANQRKYRMCSLRSVWWLMCRNYVVLSTWTKPGFQEVPTYSASAINFHVATLQNSVLPDKSIQ